jgi:hypothetical protein
LVVNHGVEVFDLAIVKPSCNGLPWIGVRPRIASQFSG